MSPLVRTKRYFGLPPGNTRWPSCLNSHPSSLRIGVALQRPTLSLSLLGRTPSDRRTDVIGQRRVAAELAVWPFLVVFTLCIGLLLGGTHRVLAQGYPPPPSPPAPCTDCQPQYVCQTCSGAVQASPTWYPPTHLGSPGFCITSLAQRPYSTIEVNVTKGSELEWEFSLAKTEGCSGPCSDTDMVIVIMTLYRRKFNPNKPCGTDYEPLVAWSAYGWGPQCQADPHPQITAGLKPGRYVLVITKDYSGSGGNYTVQVNIPSDALGHPIGYTECSSDAFTVATFDSLLNCTDSDLRPRPFVWNGNCFPSIHAGPQYYEAWRFSVQNTSTWSFSTCESKGYFDSILMLYYSPNEEMPFDPEKPLPER